MSITSAASTRWLNRRPGTGRRQRLFCLPYAGGGVASFLPWQAALGDTVEVCAVQLPGRGPRLLEPPLRSFEALVDALCPLVAEQADLPFWLFGHSLGALLAFELACGLQHRCLPQPCGLLVSGCEAPHRRAPSRRLHELGDVELVQALRDLNGTPTEILRDRELMQLLLPTIRADFELVANYRRQPGPALQVPITVLGGLQDNHAEAERLDGWQDLTVAGHAVHWLPGDHFFIDSQREAVLEILRPLLASAVSATPLRGKFAAS